MYLDESKKNKHFIECAFKFLLRGSLVPSPKLAINELSYQLCRSILNHKNGPRCSTMFWKHAYFSFQELIKLTISGTIHISMHRMLNLKLWTRSFTPTQRIKMSIHQKS
jgi:hypothetical protein